MPDLQWALFQAGLDPVLGSKQRLLRQIGRLDEEDLREAVREAVREHFDLL